MNPFNSTGRNARLAGTILLFVTFAAGGLAGAAGERVLRADAAPKADSKRGPEMRGGTRRLLLDDEFANRLQLTATQRAQIKAILDRRDAQAKQVWGEAEPRLKQVGERTKAEVQKVLTPPQVTLLEAELEKRRAVHKARHACHEDSVKSTGAREHGSTGSD